MKMVMILSPAKKLTRKDLPLTTTKPHFFHKATEVMGALRKLDITGLSKLMKISVQLAELNHQRNQDFTTTWSATRTSPALSLFDGDTYKGLDASSFNATDLNYSGEHLRIISGLYGVLAPSDGIQPYRCEMGLKLGVGNHNSLTQFWQEPLQKYFTQLDCHYLVSGASKEYFAPLSSLATQNIRKPQVIQLEFKQQKSDGYQTIGLLAKKARGRFAQFMIKNRIEKLSDLREFSADGYRYHQELSTFPQTLVFTRSVTR